MTESEKIEFLAGQVHALMGFTTAVVLSHPNVPLLAKGIETVAQANLALAEGIAVTDRYIDGIQDIWGAVRKAIAIASEPPASSKALR
jgi:hypothetical protein